METSRGGRHVDLSERRAPPFRYLNKPWKSSRIYVDAKRLWTPEDASFWTPLVAEVRAAIAERFGLGEDLERALPLEAAFVNYYVGEGTMPRDMEPHVDCDPDGVPVPLSVVVQGSWANGDDVLGVLDCRRRRGITGRGGAAAATRIFRGDESRRRRGRDVDI